MPVRKARSRNDIERPRFDVEVKPNGYAWWYVDGISDDGNKAISIIGFIGSVFLPWYYWANRKKPRKSCLRKCSHVWKGLAMDYDRKG